MKNKYKSDICRVRQEDFQGLLQFLNGDISQMNRAEFIGFVSAYIYSGVPLGSSTPFWDFMRTHGSLAGDLGRGASEEALEGRKGFLEQLQMHLRSRIEEIMRSSKTNTSSPLWQIEGVWEISVSVAADSFMQEFRAVDGQDMHKLELESQKRQADIRLAELIRDLELKPSRFRLCKRCGKFFYQQTAHEKIYCSRRCSNALRQAKFIKRRGGHEENLENG
jgi:hypothetical protein